MIFSILNCFADLLWAFVVIVLIIFVFSIIFDSAVADYFEQVDLDDPVAMSPTEDLQKYYGSMSESMISLWCAISGGNDWFQYAEVLRQLQMGEIYFSLFMFYIAFCVVGLLNVVTG